MLRSMVGLNSWKVLEMPPYRIPVYDLKAMLLFIRKYLLMKVSFFFTTLNIVRALSRYKVTDSYLFES